MYYNYLEALKEDIRNYIENEINFTSFDSIEELEEKLNNDLWTEDRVTGNASGSYTFDAWQAEENLCHNLDLLQEALAEFGCSTDYLKKGAEACDVTIRCYLLGQAIAEVIQDIKDDFNKAHEESEE